MKRINPDEFKVVNKIELSNIPTELIIDADDYKNDYNTLEGFLILDFIEGN